MTAATELRTAATRLRETAEPASRGPWQSYSGRIDSASGTIAMVYQGYVDSEWIALVSPVLAEPLAELLEETVAFVEEHPDLGREHVDGEPCDDYACGIVTRLRAVARAINGTSPAPVAPSAPPGATHGPQER